MKRLVTLAVLFCLAAPAAFAVPPADPGSQSSSPSASQLCKDQRRAMGMSDFRALYAPAGNPKAAMDACLARQVQAASTDAKNAAKACKAERASLGEQAFADKYGTPPNKKNAFGKCVSSMASEASEDHQDSTLNAAKKCKVERVSLGVQAFATKYGKNTNKRNAFGKCVSQNAKPATS